MSKRIEELDVDFVLECDEVSEIASDTEDWNGPDVQKIDSGLLAEMTKNDEKPFFIEFVGLYEALSGNDRLYTKDAVKTCVGAMVGVNMYKGHQQPGTESWNYREPVGKIVSSRISEISIDGQRVLAAKGKAYITEADPKLRSDISRKMAGPLSILGNAKSVREYGSSKRTVVHIHKPLKSIDFCNPGTNGMPLAGVTAIVREMSSHDHELEEQEPKMTTKLTVKELLAEYGSEINTIIGEQLEVQVREFATEKKQFVEVKQQFEDEKKGMEDKIAEMETNNKNLVVEKKELQDKLDAQDTKLLEAELLKFANEAVKEMKAGDDHDEKIVEMAAEDLDPVLVDGDLAKSKIAFTERLNKAIKRTEKLAEMCGGVNEDESNTRTHNRNPGKTKSKGVKIEQIMSPELLKASGDK